MYIYIYVCVRVCMRALIVGVGCNLYRVLTTNIGHTVSVVVKPQG